MLDLPIHSSLPTGSTEASTGARTGHGTLRRTCESLRRLHGSHPLAPDRRRRCDLLLSRVLAIRHRREDPQAIVFAAAANPAMRMTRDWSPARHPIHCCLLDRDCWRDYRQFHMPLRLYLHFIVDRNGNGTWIDLWGKRRHDRWFNSLDWQPVDQPRNPPDAAPAGRT